MSLVRFRLRAPVYINSECFEVLKIKDWLKELQFYLYERATSPLFGAFVVSWTIYNFKLVMILLSERSAELKITYIENVAFPGWEAGLMDGLVYPFLFAALAVAIYPWPARLAFWYTAVMQKRQNEIKRDIEGQKLLTEDRSKEILDKINDERDKYLRIISELDGRIVRLEREKATLEDNFKEERENYVKQVREKDERVQKIEVLESEIDSLRDTLEMKKLGETVFEGGKSEAENSDTIADGSIKGEEGTDDWDEDRIGYISEIAKSNNSMSIYDFNEALFNNKAKSELVLHRLENDGLIKYLANAGRYKVTTQGLELLDQKGLL